MKIVTVIGARPQFIKAATVSRTIELYNQARATSDRIEEIIVHTGQHFDRNMSDVFFEEMQIPNPNYHLEVNSLSHGAMTGRMLEKTENVLKHEKPDYVLVYGDTNSTIAGALAAKKLHIKVVHVEAGLRSFNMQMPEEVNRILTDRISDILCCPTQKAVDNLTKEGFEHISCRIVNTGDVMLDAALYYSRYSAERSTIIRDMTLKNKSYVLSTMHRAENTDVPHRLAAIVEALNELNNHIDIVMPLHPRTRKILANCSKDLNVTVIDPVGYFDMIELIKGAKLVLTDSGGLQKEAFYFSKPCVTLRDETEWTELVDEGVNVLAGADRSNICSLSLNMMVGSADYSHDLYGGGKAAERILNCLLAT